MKRLFKLTKPLLLIIVLCNIPAFAWAQAGSINQFVQVLPAVTFVSTIFISIVNVYLINRLNKSKDDVLRVVRAELNEEIKSLELRMATKEQLGWMREEMTLRLQTIEEKINRVLNKP